MEVQVMCEMLENILIFLSISNERRQPILNLKVLNGLPPFIIHSLYYMTVLLCQAFKNIHKLIFKIGFTTEIEETSLNLIKTINIGESWGLVNCGNKKYHISSESGKEQNETGLWQLLFIRLLVVCCDMSDLL